MSNKQSQAAAKKAAASKGRTKSAERAADIAQKMNVATVYENPNGEFFTDKSLALLSVSGDPKKITTHQPVTVNTPEDIDTDADTETDAGDKGPGGEGDA